jgi:hypothetical protein
MLRTLRDAGDYIQALPGATHKRPECQIAAQMLLEAVEGKGPLMFAEIAIRKAVNAERSLLNLHRLASEGGSWPDDVRLSDIVLEASHKVRDRAGLYPAAGRRRAR